MLKKTGMLWAGAIVGTIIELVMLLFLPLVLIGIPFVATLVADPRMPGFLYIAVVALLGLITMIVYFIPAIVVMVLSVMIYQRQMAALVRY